MIIRQLREMPWMRFVVLVAVTVMTALFPEAKADHTVYYLAVFGGYPNYSGMFELVGLILYALQIIVPLWLVADMIFDAYSSSFVAEISRHNNRTGWLLKQLTKQKLWLLFAVLAQMFCVMIFVEFRASGQTRIAPEPLVQIVLMRLLLLVFLSTLLTLLTFRSNPTIGWAVVAGYSSLLPAVIGAFGNGSLRAVLVRWLPPMCGLPLWCATPIKLPNLAPNLAYPYGHSWWYAILYLFLLCIAFNAVQVFDFNKLDYLRPEDQDG